MKILGLVISYFCLTFAINSTLHFAWANKEIESKLIFYDNNESNINTLFMGSSHTWNGVIPELFDSLNRNRKSSYNLASAGLQLGELRYIIKQMESKDLFSNIDTVFLEVEFDRRQKQKVSNREKYYYNISTLLFYLSSSNKMDHLNTIEEKSFHVRYFIENLLSLGMLKEKVMSRFEKVPNEDLVLSNMGYKNRKIFDKRNGKKRKKYSRTAESKKIEALNVFFKKIFAEKIDVTSEVEFINSFDKYLKQRGKKLIAYVMPRLTEREYKYLVPIFDQITSEKYNFANPIEHPELYGHELGADKTHYNKKGAEVFTNYLYKKISE